MARVTIEDCLEKVDDRFELVALAAQRARDISSGSPLTIERNGEKDTVISLREIAETTIGVDVLKEEYITSFQKEKNILDGFISPANDGSFSEENVDADSISMDEEEADIRAAISDAGEESSLNEEFTTESLDALIDAAGEDEAENPDSEEE